MLPEAFDVRHIAHEREQTREQTRLAALAVDRVCRPADINDFHNVLVHGGFLPDGTTVTHHQYGCDVLAANGTEMTVAADGISRPETRQKWAQWLAANSAASDHPSSLGGEETGNDWQSIIAIGQTERAHWEQCSEQMLRLDSEWLWRNAATSIWRACRQLGFVHMTWDVVAVENIDNTQHWAIGELANGNDIQLLHQHTIDGHRWSMHPAHTPWGQMVWYSLPLPAWRQMIIAQVTDQQTDHDLVLSWHQQYQRAAVSMYDGWWPSDATARYWSLLQQCLHGHDSWQYTLADSTRICRQGDMVVVQDALGQQRDVPVDTLDPTTVTPIAASLLRTLANASAASQHPDSLGGRQRWEDYSLVETESLSRQLWVEWLLAQRQHTQQQLVG